MKTQKSSLPETLESRLKALKAHINNAAHRPEAPPATPLPPKLIAVSKTHPVGAIEEAIALGVSDFGENRVQEAMEKYPALKDKHPQIRLHLIGPLQSNKAKEAVALFDVIHTIDRPKIVDAIAKAVAGHQSPVTSKFLIQVNIGEEPQKAGVMPQDLEELIRYWRLATGDRRLDGLMCIPPAHENPAPYFALMSQLKRTHQLAELSMGMSGDYETAIRFGATMIRVGTALFGERK